ncbi:hypothetical protein BX666DRAFT_552294 [Dichotomocladium elegans]|nr:hypothetical protein BX666DRAFT_552294 [Dichotomocladium elegans]
MGTTHSHLMGGSGAPKPNAVESRADMLQRLLKDPNFHLIKVTRKGRTVESLTVVTPASDRAVARDVEKFGWYCISHFWGDPSTRKDWNGPDVVSSDTGEVLSAKLFPSKCPQIVDLFATWAGYWWMDIFCARSDTPLVIMGDVYSLCRRCFALIDTYHKNINLDVQRMHHYMKSSMEPAIGQCVQDYLDAIVNNSTKTAQSLDERIENEPNCQRKEIFNTYVRSSEEELRASLRSYGPETLEHAVIKEVIEARNIERWEAFGLDRYAKAICNILDSQWMSRVWMIQESALPFIVNADTQGQDKGGLTYETAASFYYLEKTLECCLRIAGKAYQIRRDALIRTIPTGNWSQEHTPTSPHQMLKLYRDVDPPLARIYTDYRKLLEVILALGPSQEYGAEVNITDIRLLYLNTFATSQRRATCSLDYVYGVLGIMNIDIPPMKDAQEIWRLFSEKLKERFPAIHVPCDVDLTTANVMQDVYGGIGFINDEFMSAHDTIASFIGDRDSRNILDCFDSYTAVGGPLLYDPLSCRSRW